MHELDPESDPSAEDALILAVRAGELEAFERLLRLHASRLRAFVAMRLPVPHLIDEIAHEAFVFAYSHMEDFEVGTDFGKWLRAIAFNLVRKETLRHKRVAKNHERYLEHCLVESAGRSGAKPESPVIAYLEECVDALPDSQRTLTERRTGASSETLIV